MVGRAFLRGAGPGTIVGLEGPDRDMLQELTLLRLAPGQVEENARPRERAYLLLSGTVTFTAGAVKAEAARASLVDDGPWTLHVPAGAKVTIAARGAAELAVMETENPRTFAAKIYTPEECRGERRGEGTLDETATRIVRTIFDDTNAPQANLVLGEVITQAGRWSSYPPHHHPQPEIYHYRLDPENGFGLAMVGDQCFVVRSGDTTLIREGQVHPQAAAPGYTMWYLWSIRHLDGNRYRTPTFVPEHAWTMKHKGGPR